MSNNKLGRPDIAVSESGTATSPTCNTQVVVGSREKCDGSSDTLVKVLTSLLSWPFVALSLLLYLLFFPRAPDRFATLLRPFRSLKFFGTEFVLDRQSGETANAAILVYRREVQQKFDRFARKWKLADLHQEVVDQFLSSLGKGYSVAGFRSTLHVPDMLLADTFYQLLDYYPKPGGRGGRGRTWSTRFGLIGKAWRLEQSQYEPSVPGTPTILVTEWGMTLEEAQRAGQQRHSFAGIVIKNSGGRILAVFYMDASDGDAFGPRDRLATIESTICTASQSSGLTEALQLLHRESIASSPQVQIYD